TFTDSGLLLRIRGYFYGFGATFTDSGLLLRIRGYFYGFGATFTDSGLLYAETDCEIMQGKDDSEFEI
ncbi:MAG: hypothetical protein LKI94_03085, partial [Sporolactobacillus sp.]|nr:hypothetical protein [Sporolactobacillus sp.]